ncbi:MAG: hypothetical protein V3S50_06815, partial [Acidobacteriota bacterium]
MARKRFTAEQIIIKLKSHIGSHSQSKLVRVTHLLSPPPIEMGYFTQLVVQIPLDWHPTQLVVQIPLWMASHL